MSMGIEYHNQVVSLCRLLYLLLTCTVTLHDEDFLIHVDP